MNDFSPHLFLIALTDNARERLTDFEISEDQIIEDFNSSEESVYLYNRGFSNGSLTTSLPIKGGIGELLLKRKPDENYYVCINIKSFEEPVTLSKSNRFRYALPLGSCITVVDGWETEEYREDVLLDCDEIEQAVSQKKFWNPHVGEHVEDRKWSAYLRLYEFACENRKVNGLYGKIILVDGGKKIKVDLGLSSIETEIEERILRSKGEVFTFSLTLPEYGGENARNPKLGTLLGANKVKGNLRLTFNLDSDFSQSFSHEVKNNPSYSESQMLDGTSDTSIKKSIPPKHENLQEKVNPSHIYLHAECIGDLSQIHIMRRGLNQVKKLPIWKVLTEEDVAKLPDEEESTIYFEDDCILDEGQKNAVCKALRAKELLLIWGPPGTGKTEVITEIAQQEAKRGGTTLIVSQANLAVDNAIARLHDKSHVWPLRIAKDDWNPEEDDKTKIPTQDTAGSFFLDWMKQALSENEDEEVDGDVISLRKEFIVCLNQMKNQNFNYNVERTFQQMAKLYKDCLNVVGATLMESGRTIKPSKEKEKEKEKQDNAVKYGKNSIEYNLSRITGIEKFDTIIVDEVSKAIPLELFLPLPLGGENSRLILVGDHRQLPPVIKDFVSGDDQSLELLAEEARIPEEHLNLEYTLFERLWDKHREEHLSDVRAMLTTQYRMHEDIQQLVERFYTDEKEGQLKCGLTKDEQRKLSVAQSGFFADRHVMWVRTGKSNESRENREGTSYLNHREIQVVGSVLKSLPDLGDDISVGVITFYGAQLAALSEKYHKKFRDKFPGGLIFGTVDRFQGRECDVIICSLVRNNKKGKIGFAERPNRINVAFSRARRLLCIVGNVDTFCFINDSPAQEIYMETYNICLNAKSCIFESQLPEKIVTNNDLENLHKRQSNHVR